MIRILYVLSIVEEVAGGMAQQPQDGGTDVALEHGRWVRGLARALGHDEHDREDAVQDTWAAALEGLQILVCRPLG